MKIVSCLLIILLEQFSLHTCASITELDEDPSLVYVPKELIDKLPYEFFEKFKNNASNSWEMRQQVNSQNEQQTKINREKKEDDDRLAAEESFLNLIQEVALIRVDPLRRHMYSRKFIHAYNSSEGKVIFKIGSEECEWKIIGREGSTCPHHVEIVVRENFRPRLISVAKCNCMGCLTPERWPDKIISLSGVCEPVYSYSWAYKRTDDNKWESVIEKIPTSCTCKLRTHGVGL